MDHLTEMRMSKGLLGVDKQAADTDIGIWDKAVPAGRQNLISVPRSCHRLQSAFQFLNLSAESLFDLTHPVDNLIFLLKKHDLIQRYGQAA